MATAELWLMLPTDAGALAGYLAGALQESTHAVVDVLIDATWSLRWPPERGWIGRCDSTDAGGNADDY